MCTSGEAVALAEAMGSTKPRRLENREVQVAPFRGLFCFVAFLSADTYMYCSKLMR